MRTFAVRKTQSITLALAAAILATLLIAISTGCGSREAAAEEQPNPTAITVQVTQAPVPTSTPEPPKPTATPEPDLSADEQILREMHDNWSNARINREYDHFDDNCNPEFVAPDTRTLAERDTAWK